MSRKNTDLGVRGFTLIEVLLALCLLMVVLLPITTIMSVSNRHVTQNEKTLQAKNLAQSKIEELKAISWYDFRTNYLEGQQGQSLPGADNEPDDSFTYRVAVWPTDNDLVYTIQVTVFYKEAGHGKWLNLYSEKSRR